MKIDKAESIHGYKEFLKRPVGGDKQNKHKKNNLWKNYNYELKEHAMYLRILT